MALVYIVEDDDSIRDLILYALQTTEFSGEGFESSEGFFARMKVQKPDLVLLDIMLPGADGLSILKSLRNGAQTRELPVILLTAKGDEYDKVRGLDLGADDYVTKPFSVLELLSRIRAVLRRMQSQPADHILHCRNVQLDTLRHTVRVDDDEVALTFKEFEVLQLLMEYPGMVFTRSRLLSVVWGTDFEGESRTVDMHIKTLRQKLGCAREMIQTVRGVGYKAEE